jgi:alpha-L-fucosidase
MANGEVPQEQIERIRDIGAWLDINGSSIFDTHPFVPSTLVTTDGRAVRLTQDHDGTTYAIILGDSPDATIAIEGLPLGDITLLGHVDQLARHGNTVTLPSTPRNEVAYVLRIAQ